jgi:TonB family protein
MEKAIPRSGPIFHPRQTIISTPLRPTHPRQILIQPAAPKEPPKILPALPNIVQLASSQPAQPKLQITPKQLAVMRPKARASLASSDVAAPEVIVPVKDAGAISISSAQVPPKPVLQVKPMSAPRATPQRKAMDGAAPEIAGHIGDNNTLIALSATPAPVAPPPAIPAGNLSARVSISPDGTKPAAAKPSAGASGPEGIFISDGNSGKPSAVSGLGIGNALPSRPGAGAATEGSKTSRADSGSHAISKLNVSPEKVLGSKQVYTLRVNMPNMTSISGSWIVNFAELDETEPGVYAKSPAASDLVWPVALRKVDPKYPPELRKGNVEGEVVLYAIIRKDGSVDSIQVVQSVDPTLDTNAMEALSQWKFQPAQKHGEPIELEAVVHIPFRTRPARF